MIVHIALRRIHDVVSIALDPFTNFLAFRDGWAVSPVIIEKHIGPEAE